MALSENQDTSKTQGDRIPIILLRLVNAIYVIWLIMGVVRFVWSHLLFIQTGNIEQFSSTVTSSNPNFKGYVFDGLTQVLIYGLIIKGLTSKNILARYVTFFEAGFKISAYVLAFVAHVEIPSGGHFVHSFIKIGDLNVLTIVDWWGIPFYGVLMIINAFKIYVLSRRDVRELFQKTTPAPSVPEGASG